MFKTFPEFSKLTLANKDEYEALISKYSPIHDISFAGLLTWWDTYDTMSISQINDNLIVPYWLPGDERHSGLSLIGTNKIDESLCEIFDYLKAKNEPAKLVNVPEFVVSHVRYPEMFTFKSDRFYDEYILPIANFYPLGNMTSHRRRKVERQLTRVGEENIVAKSLALDQLKNKELILDTLNKWQAKGINNYGKLELDAIRACVESIEFLDLQNVCLFVNDELYGFCLYRIPEQDKRYAIVHHIKATHVSTLGLELMAYTFGKWFAEQGVLYVNVNADFGLLRLRMFMLTLGPYNFFRKYTVEPT